MTTSAASSGSGISAASSPLKVGGPASAPLSQSVFSQSSMASSIMPFSEPSCSVSMYERIQELETVIINVYLFPFSILCPHVSFITATEVNIGDVINFNQEATIQFLLVEPLN